MPNPVVIFMGSLYITGALGISYVESRLIAKGRFMNFGKKTLIDRYWRDLALPEKLIFWISLCFLISPFFFALSM